MPKYLSSLLLAVIVFAASSARAEEDRYATWRRQQIGNSTNEVAASVTEPAAFVPDETASPVPIAPDAAAPEAWQSPPQSPPQTRRRQLPIRFVKSSEHVSRSRVVRASAIEPVESPKQGISKPKDAKPLALKRETSSTSGRAKHSVPIATLGGSVAIVVGLFMIVAWATRRGMPKQPPQLPREALEVLGRKRITAKQEVQLLRIGNKLVLVNMVLGATETITEITDPAEVDRLTGLCYQSSPHSSSAGFRQMLGQMSRERKPKRSIDLPRSLDDVELAFSRNHFDE